MKEVKFKDMEEGKVYIAKMGSVRFTKKDGLLYEILSERYSYIDFDDASKLIFVEVKEPNERVKCFLDILNDEYTHIAMDKYGDVYAYTTAHVKKGIECWSFDYNKARIFEHKYVRIGKDDFNLDFSFLSFEDERPYKFR